MYAEITKETFNAIVENEQNCFVSNTKKELSETNTFFSKGVKLLTVVNFVSNTKQYYIQDINA